MLGAVFFREMLSRFIESSIRDPTSKASSKMVYQLLTMLCFLLTFTLICAAQLYFSGTDYDNLKKDYIELSTVYMGNGDALYDMNSKLTLLERYTESLRRDNKALLAEVLEVTRENERLRQELIGTCDREI